MSHLTGHYVLLDRDDPDGPTWKLVTEVSRRFADLDEVGVPTARDEAGLVTWVTTVLLAVVAMRPVPAPVLRRVHDAGDRH